MRSSDLVLMILGGKMVPDTDLCEMLNGHGGSCLEGMVPLFLFRSNGSVLLVGLGIASG